MQNNRILSFNMAKVLEAKELEQVVGLVLIYPLLKVLTKMVLGTVN
jgi:hypothetical protein